MHRSQVLGAFAGLRPLVDSGGGSTADVSRRHLVATSNDGFVSVLGGKLTTYRRMAEDAVDQALRNRGLTAPPSHTASLRLVGFARVESAAPLVEGVGLTAAEAADAVRTQGALTVEDVLDRRSRIGLVPEERARVLPLATELVARALDELS